MNNVWLMVLAVMIGGSLLKYMIMNPLAAVAIDLAIFAAAYLIMRRYPYIDLRRSMLFLGGVTIINVLVDFRLISSLIGDIAFLAFILIMIFGQSGGGGTSRPTKMRHKWHK